MKESCIYIFAISSYFSILRACGVTKGCVRCPVARDSVSPPGVCIYKGQSTCSDGFRLYCRQYSKYITMVF